LFQRAKSLPLAATGHRLWPRKGLFGSRGSANLGPMALYLRHRAEYFLDDHAAPFHGTLRGVARQFRRRAYRADHALGHRTHGPR
jgi:hypothetical protein